MFDRNIEGRLAEFDVVGNLHRFNGDSYATTYLVGCFNPEFEIKMTFPKDYPKYSDSCTTCFGLHGRSVGGIF